MSIQKKVKKSLLEGNTIELAGMEFRKMTASSFTLCELLELRIVSGKSSKYPQFEILAFLYIHFVGSREARKLIYDESEGVDKQGRSKVFVDACMDWADDLPFSDYTKLAQGIGQMLEEGFSGAVETQSEKVEGNDRKVA